MGKKVNWGDLKERLDEIFGPDVMGLDDWNEEEVVKESPVLDFILGEKVEKLTDVNIEHLGVTLAPDYDDQSESGDVCWAAFSLEDKIYKVTFTHFSYSGYSLEHAKAEEVAPKIKQIIYYE